MPASSLAARCSQLHAAAERGDGAAGRRLERLAARGPRAGQAAADLTMGWHRHPGRPGQLDCCDDTGCPEALDAALWVASWESWWPPGKPPGA